MKNLLKRILMSLLVVIMILNIIPLNGTADLEMAVSGFYVKATSNSIRVFALNLVEESNDLYVVSISIESGYVHNATFQITTSNKLSCIQIDYGDAVESIGHDNYITNKSIESMRACIASAEELDRGVYFVYKFKKLSTEKITASDISLAEIDCMDSTIVYNLDKVVGNKKYINVISNLSDAEKAKMIAEENEAYQSRIEKINDDYNSAKETYTNFVNEAKKEYGVSYLSSFSYYNSLAQSYLQQANEKNQRILYLKRDTTGSNSSQIAKLQKEVDELQKEAKKNLILAKVAEAEETLESLDSKKNSDLINAQNNHNATLKKIEKATNRYTVILDAKEGSFGSTDNKTEFNETFPLPTPTRSGYTCIGWSTDSTATTATYNCGAAYKPIANVTLYAVWKANTVAVTLGDVNSDKKINSNDALLILQHTVGSINLSTTQKQAADVTKDNKVNSNDALKVLQYTVGSIKSF